jgi:hypothetical protein
MERRSTLDPGSGGGSKPGSSSDPHDLHDSHDSHANDVAQQAQVTELTRRIELLEDEDAHGYGDFSAADWIVCILGAVVIPVLVLVWVGR